jgi:uncharacterized protein YndB with AHSA1/START domain
MATIEFELERTINAPIGDVFARLADLEGYNDWMPKKGSMFRGSEQTSPGEVGLGTTFVDQTTFGPSPGEIVEFDAPRSIVFHWWDRSKSGKLKTEGWPGYALEAADDGTTLVCHHAKMHAYGIYRLAAPIFRRMAFKERTATIDALKASFESRA